MNTLEGFGCEPALILAPATPPDPETSEKIKMLIFENFAILTPLLETKNF